MEEFPPLKGRISSDISLIMTQRDTVSAALWVTWCVVHSVDSATEMLYGVYWTRGRKVNSNNGGMTNDINESISLTHIHHP